MISGDLGDTRIMIVLLEHWRSFFLDIEEWSSPLFFYPVKGVLGNTDAHLLYAPIYSALRNFLDVYASYEMTLASTRLMGFFFMALFLRSILQLPHWATLVGALVFTILASNYVHLGHGQFVVTAYIPLLMYFAVYFMRAEPASATSWWSGLGLAALFGLLMLSTFYVAWYAALTALILAVLIGLAVIKREGLMHTTAFVWAWARQRVGVFAAMVVVLICAAIPFASLYLSRLREHGGYPLEEILTQAQNVGDLLNAGSLNWVWGSIFSDYRFSWMTPNFGFATGLTLLTLSTVIWSANRILVQGRASFNVAFSFFVGLSGLVVWLSFMRFGDWSPYWLIYHFVPRRHRDAGTLSHHDVSWRAFCACGNGRARQPCRDN